MMHSISSLILQKVACFFTATLLSSSLRGIAVSAGVWSGCWGGCDSCCASDRLLSGLLVQEESSGREDE